MKTIAVLQSSYIPWKGYFDIINSVDEFVLYDTVQYSKGTWRNRNQIKTPQGLIWLSVPIVKPRLSQTINTIEIANNNWQIKHWKSIKQYYNKAPFFKMYKDIFQVLYEEKYTSLSLLNVKFIRIICMILGIQTKISFSEDFQLIGDSNQRLISICQQTNASHYLSGPAAMDYLDVDLFERHNINIKWMDYVGYKEYSQLYPPFVHGVSILDLIFNEGSNAKDILKNDY